MGLGDSNLRVSVEGDEVVIRSASAGEPCHEEVFGRLVAYTDRERDGPDSMHMEISLTSGELSGTLVAQGLGEVVGRLTACIDVKGGVPNITQMEWRVPKDYARGKQPDELQRELLDVLVRVAMVFALPVLGRAQGAARSSMLAWVLAAVLAADAPPERRTYLLGALAEGLLGLASQQRDPDLAAEALLVSAVRGAPPERQNLLIVCLIAVLLGGSCEVRERQNDLIELLTRFAAELGRSPPDVAAIAAWRLLKPLSGKGEPPSENGSVPREAPGSN